MSETAQETIESTIPAPEASAEELRGYVALLDGLRIRTLAGLVAWAKWEQNKEG